MPVRTALFMLTVQILWCSGARAGADDIVLAARSQIGVTLRYDPAYERIPFPGGDVPRERGVCTDVVIRALRDARRFDLQEAVNIDIAANWDAYRPGWRWARKRPDPSIDHRRVPNLMTYFQRRGHALQISTDPRKYQAGDIVAWDLGAGVLHIGIVSDRSIADRPLIIHNIGSGAREEDVLFGFKRIIGHFRLP